MGWKLIIPNDWEVYHLILSHRLVSPEVWLILLCCAFLVVSYNVDIKYLNIKKETAPIYPSPILHKELYLTFAIVVNMHISSCPFFSLFWGAKCWIVYLSLAFLHSFTTYVNILKFIFPLNIVCLNLSKLLCINKIYYFSQIHSILLYKDVRICLSCFNEHLVNFNIWFFVGWLVDWYL